MRHVRLVLLIALVALVVPQVAKAADTSNDLGIVVGYIDPTSNSTIGGLKTEAKSTIDYGIEYKHRFLESKRLSLGGTVLYSQFDVDQGGQKIGTIDNWPILIDVNWHFLEKKNLYAGVTAGYAMWGDFKPEGGGSSTKVKQNAVYGVNIGWDFPIGERWAILTNLRYLGSKVETDQSGVANTTTNVNPIIFNVGFAWRF
jgi:outer membrane protein W